MTFDEQVATRTLAQEVRGEPIEGQQAVAYVLKNRLKSGRWGHTLASVCLWPHQFSGWASAKDPNFAYACGLMDSDKTLDHMLSVLNAALESTSDPTGGATHYYNPDIVSHEPAWVKGDPAGGVPAAIFCGKFGRQTFWRGVM